MEEYIFFIDETLKTSKNPYFCMSGICVKRNYYEDVITQEINSLKSAILILQMLYFIIVK